ncbi:MAG TPA: non-hemolytic enterotoxin lytic component L1 [Pseudomonas sp.]|nr:non-hemolytic enterotoxin lytic component L1 [Pseudomonas sp.]
MMNVALTNPNDMTQAPDNLFGNTGTSYNASQLITFACHALANTVFTSPSPQPQWFPTLNSELLAAQALAQQWIGTLGPQVSSTIPLQVINFGSDFTAATTTIQQIVAQDPSAQGADNPNVIEIQTIIQDTLLQPIEQVISAMTTTSTSLTNWGTQMQTAHTNLSSGATNIQSTETALQANITQMNDAITSLTAEIQQENEIIAGSAAGIGVGIFGLVAGIALAPETGGASLLVGGVVGAAGIIGGGVTWGVMQSKINSQFAQIAADQQTLQDDQRELVALQGLQIASSGALASINLATQFLSKLQTQWGTLQGELKGVVSQLENAENSVQVITQGVFTNAAITEWTTAMQTANNLVNTKIQIQSQMLPM